MRRVLVISAILLSSTLAHAEPATLEEYNAEMAQLRAAVRAAKSEGDDAAVADLRAKVARLRGYGALHLHKQDPDLFTGGFATLGLGSAVLVGGAVAYLVGAFSNCQTTFIFPICSGDQTAMIGGGIAMGVGTALALASIPMIVAGNKRVFDRTPRVVVGPTRVGIVFSF